MSEAHSDPLFTPARIVPTDEQLRIQATRARHVLIEANAGAAKTTTLALRMAQALARGAAPSMLLALTYTAPAVQALRQQLRFIGLAAEQVDAIRIHSFESFSAWLLEGMEGTGTQQLRTMEQVRPHLLRAIERAQTLPNERYPEELLLGASPNALLEGLLKSFAVLKGRLLMEQLTADEALSPAVAQELGFDYLTLRVRAAYEWIRRGGHPDRPVFRFEGDACYDLARAVLAGECETGAESPFALGLALIVVDEMHDTNRAMFTVLKALLEANRRAAFVGVGDRDQVIHAQSGAEAAFMQERFVEEVGQPLRLPLTASHRFGPRLAAAVGCLAHKPYAASVERDTEIDLLTGESPRVLAQLIGRLAHEHLAQTNRRDLRILLRQPAHSIRIERELLKLGVPYEVEGFEPFLRRREVLMVRGLHAFCTDDFSGFAEPALRAQTLEALMLFAGSWVDSIELRHLDAVSGQRQAVAEASAHPNGMRSFIEGQVLRNASASALQRLRAAMRVLNTQDLAVFAAGFVEALDPRALATGVLVRKEDIQQVHDNLTQLAQLAAQEEGPLSAFFRLLDQLHQGHERVRSRRRVTLSSIEAAKGLEFDHVLIPYLARGEFVGEGGPVENRNLLYVAMTRARQRLTLAFNPAAPSRYLRDAGLID